MPVDGQRPAGFGQVLRHREARALLIAAGVSDLGDQITRVALSVLVLHRTGSVLLTACVYAVSYLPWLVGGPVLATLADRFPVRRVLVGSDLVRAFTVGLMVVPGLPVWALLLLMFLTELAAPPFQAGRSALLPEVLAGDSYVAGAALLSAVGQCALFGGVAAGGALLLVLDPTTALLLDAGSFLLSALVLRRGLRRRPAPGGAPLSLSGDTVAGLHAVFGSPRLRRLLLGAWIACAAAVLPEGLALAYATSLGAPPSAVALLLAAEPLGGALAGLLVARLVPPACRERLVWPLLCLASLPLAGMLLQPGLVATTLLLFSTGASGAGLLLTSTTIGRTVDSESRGRVFGIAASGLMAAQGLALLAGGALAELLPVHVVMALAGVLGALAVAPLALADRRDRPAPAVAPEPDLVPQPRAEPQPALTAR